ncbi:heavy metal translocating P-type ATPase [Tepidicella baoligensis]|uniref:heavy metal translocating P-type ATPase n=1 Tax=Tepidicella baoligensis TaxID=2707016 RepID=UPI0015DBC2D1|nr:cation-translocating P-type ATPase [Tepidicella baoligensis]
MSDSTVAQQPGAAVPTLPEGHRGPLTVDDDFLVLDDPVEQADFTRPCPGQGRDLTEAVLMVQGMYCAACANTVEDVLAAMPGVEAAQVHAATRRLTVRWDPRQVRLSALARAVGRAGYRLLPMQQALGVEERLAETRKALWRLFVAGFCMMQVMMYAWPSYVTEPGEIPADIDQLLRWASFVLSIPVVVFSSGPFFQSAWRDLKHGRIGMDTPVSIGILACFFVSVAATYDPSGPWGEDVWYDSLTMFVFFLLGGRYLEFRLRDRTAGALDALMNRLPELCERQLPDGGFESVSIKRLAVGDVVRVQAGQAFPGDATVLSEGATVDEALLTGESQPLTRRRGESVVAGSYNLAGTALVRIDKLGRDTRFAQIVSLMEQASTEKPRLVRLVDRIAAPFLVLVMLSAATAGYYWWQIDPGKALAVAVAVLIVTCPCALSLATPSALLASAGALAGRGILVRRLQAFETLARVDTFVFDKTGTLTQDRVVLREVIARPGLSRADALALAYRLSAASLHPVSRAIAQAAREEVSDLPSLPGDQEVRDIPGAGLVLSNGAGQAYRLGSARHGGLDESALLAEGHTVPDAPCAYLTDADGWLATFVMDEGVRADAAEAIAALRRQGLHVRLLSGDRLAAALRVARQVGVDDVVAEASPERKLQEVVALQQQGATIAMVGDGLNDGPVLARADVSFALGHGAPLTQSQSDFVVQSGRLSEVVQTVLQARRTLQIVKQNLWWAGAYNAVSVPMAVVGWMPPWAAGLGMALSSFLVIGNAMRLGRIPVVASEPIPTLQPEPLVR